MDTPAERLPPQNREAEEAVLGSLLIDPDAIFEVSSFLKPDSFYSTINRWIYEVILEINSRNEPVDTLTVIEALRRKGQLEDIGGEAYIIGLVSVVPTSINAEAYGRIVEAAGVRRDLLGVAGQIAKLAYDEDEDINIVLDRSEHALFTISEQRTTKDLMPVNLIAQSYLERIEKLHNQGEDVVGVPTGFTDLDNLLGGLNKSDLIILAARPGMGKTALMLSICLTAATVFNKRIAMFNLEMSGEQLVQRMLANETRINLQSLMRGKLQDHEWGILYEAVKRLSETSIFIDDTPNVSPMQLRTKCRRLYAEHGIDLVVIDYLQLMQGDSNSNNRVQEIGEISRGLKQLARELDVPVVAAAQLSRGVESRQDKRPVLSDLRDSGCLTGDTLIPIADTGIRTPIRELVGQKGFNIWALNEQTLKVEKAAVSNAFSTGIKQVYKLTTRLGRTIRATANHKFREFSGWKRLDQLELGDRLALPHHTNTTDQQIPASIWQEHVKPVMKANGITDRQMQASINQTYCGSSLYKQNVSRQRALTVADAVNSQPLRDLAKSDVYWDEIVSIEPDGKEEVFDLTVPIHHNFIANNIIVHNSIEQDADIVMFIYRDEYYNPETTDRPNIAEVNIAKHRNGPTASLDLYWNSQYASFANLQRQEVQL